MREVDTPQGRVRLREAGQGQRTLLLAVDPPNVLEMYSPLMVALKPHLRVVAFEPAGFGRSTPGPAHGHDLDAQADGVLALADALRLERVVLALPCVGAFAALRAAARRPGLVEGIVAIQAPSWGDARRWIARVDANGLLRAPLLGPAVGYVRAPEIARRWYEAALPTREEGAAFGRLAVEAFDHGARFPLSQAFRALERADAPPATEKPVLHVWGALDRTHRGSDPEGFRAHAPRATFVRVEDAAHFPELERPRRFADELARWLKEIK